MKNLTASRARHMPAPLFMGMNRRTVLRAGYGTIIVLLVFSAWEAYTIQADVSEQHLSIYRQYVKEDEALRSLRYSIWVGVSHLRDFFLSPRPDRLNVLRAQLKEIEQESARSLEQLGTLNWPGDKYAGMREAVREFWATIEPVANAREGTSAQAAYEFLQREIVPRRSALNEALRQLAVTSQQALQRSEEEFASSRRAASQRLLVMLACGLLVGIAIARFSLKYSENLESEAERQYSEVVQAKQELERLSARLLEVAEESRRRLARELHDEIGQTLTALRIEISHALGAARLPEGRERLERARRLAEKSVEATRNIALLLRPPLLDDLGLVPALQWHLEDFSRRSGIACDFRDEDVDESLPDPVKTCVYRVVQEALNNCEKHARATEVRLSVRQAAGVLRVEVGDNGCGFSSGSGKPAVPCGLGILGMRERASMVGGTLSVDTIPGQGTRITLELPLQAQAESAAPARQGSAAAS